MAQCEEKNIQSVENHKLVEFKENGNQKEKSNSGNLEEETQSITQKDSGYSWVVCFASSVSQMLQCGLLYSMGIFFIIFRENLKGDISDLTYITSINAFSTFMTAPVAGYMTSKIGGRKTGIIGALFSSVGLILTSLATEFYQLYFTYGILGGTGLGLQYNPCLCMLAEYFDKKLGVASGIASAGCGLGSIVFPFFIEYLVSVYGWRGALLIFGGIMLNSTICCALFKPNTQIKYIGIENIKQKGEIETQNGKNPVCLDDNEKSKMFDLECEKQIEAGFPSVAKGDDCFKKIAEKLTHFRYHFNVLKIPRYMMFCISQFFMMISVSIIYTHFGAYAKSLDYTTADAAMLFLLIGVSSSVCRVLAGLMLRVPNTDSLLIYSISHIILGVLTLLFPFYRTLPLLMLYGVFYGTFSSPFNTYNVPIIACIVPEQLIPSSVGILLLFLAPGSLFGAPLASTLYEWTGIYLSSFYLAGILMIISGLATIPLCLDKLLKSFSKLYS